MSLLKPREFAAADAARAVAFLDRVCAAPSLHARLLNTLSLLEHVGSRKIMVSQSRALPDRETLKHLAEETRHAYFFKRAAEGLAGRPLGYDAADLLAGPQARAYMGRLDAFIARAVQGPAVYLFMSLVIEIRAVWFYRLYQDVLRRRGLPLSLNSLLAEETQHLQEMEKHLRAAGADVDSCLPRFLAFEQARYAALMAALDAAAP